MEMGRNSVLVPYIRQCYSKSRMSLVEEYQKQYKWRDWPTAYSLLPIHKGQVVLDLGCGVGDITRDLASRAQKVIGIDSNDELLEFAGRNAPSNVHFMKGDLSDISSLELPAVDGIWASFSAAYFMDFGEILKRWCLHLRPGGWLALIEADDILGHAPMDERARKIIQRYYADSYEKGRYDFEMGRKLKSYVESQGMDIILAQTLMDKELSFHGPATSAVLDAWKRRLTRLGPLQDMCGEDWPQFRMRFMAALIDEGHKSKGTVHFVIGRAPRALTLA